MTTDYIGGPRNEDQPQQDQITEALADILEHRAVIEQAKGVLMFVYGVADEEAFDLLRCRSQEDNVKLRDLAEQLMEDFRGTDPADREERATAYLDRLLSTAHERIDRN